MSFAFTQHYFDEFQHHLNSGDASSDVEAPFAADLSKSIRVATLQSRGCLIPLAGRPTTGEEVFKLRLDTVLQRNSNRL
jgi:hypothetical protein